MDIKVEESRFIDLVAHEKEAEYLFEKIVLMYAKIFMQKKLSKYSFNEDKKDIEEFINLELEMNNIQFDSKIARVWFNSMGRGSCLYWAYHDSKSILDVNKLINESTIPNKQDE